MEDYKLESEWTLWEHQKNTDNNYEKNSCRMGTFSTIPEFWKYYKHYPTPSKIFFDGKTKSILKDPDREVTSISLFRKGIEPKWEDSKNRNGGELALRKFKSLEYLDSVWEDLSMYCIGEQFNKSDYITGIRVVDSSIPTNKRMLHRVEIWFSDLSVKDEIEKSFREFFQIGNFNQLYFKEHCTAVESNNTTRK
jgi:hypothetical protein